MFSSGRKFLFRSSWVHYGSPTNPGLHHHIITFFRKKCIDFVLIMLDVEMTVIQRIFEALFLINAIDNFKPGNQESKLLPGITS